MSLVTYSALPVGPGTGTNTANSDGTGVSEGQSFVATRTGTITTVARFVRSGGTNTSLRMAIYTNSAGVPNVRLGAEVVATTATNDAWNYYGGFAASVTSGTTYWVCYLPLGGTANYSDFAASGGNTKTTAGGQTTLTDPAAAFSVGPFTNIVNTGVMGDDGGSPRVFLTGVGRGRTPWLYRWQSQAFIEAVPAVEIIPDINMAP